MPKRRRSRKQLPPVRLRSETRDLIDRVIRETGASVTDTIHNLVATGDDFNRGNETAAKNRRKFYAAAAELHQAEIKADEKLAPKRATLRSLRSLLKITGPDIAEAPPLTKGDA